MVKRSKKAELKNRDPLKKEFAGGKRKRKISGDALVERGDGDLLPQKSREKKEVGCGRP